MPEVFKDEEVRAVSLELVHGSAAHPTRKVVKLHARCVSVARLVVAVRRRACAPSTGRIAVVVDPTATARVQEGVSDREEPRVEGLEKLFMRVPQRVHVRQRPVGHASRFVL